MTISAAHSIAGVWIACAATFVVFERFVANDGKVGVWDTSNPWVSVVAYGLLCLFSPFVVIFAAYIVVGHWAWIGWRSLTGRPVWLDDDRDSVIARLIKRRQRYDNRLSGYGIDDWPVCRLWEEPEAIIFDVADMYLTLKYDGVSEPQIWQKLEAFKSKSGKGGLPPSPTLIGYVKYRLSIEYPRYVALGEKLVQRQVSDCVAYVLQRLDNDAQHAGYPPSESFCRKLSTDGIEWLGVGPCDAQAIRTQSDRETLSLKFRMLDGDEVWTYNAFPTRGIALVRNGQSIAHVVTNWTSARRGD